MFLQEFEWTLVTMILKTIVWGLLKIYLLRVMDSMRLSMIVAIESCEHLNWIHYNT